MNSSYTLSFLLFAVVLLGIAGYFFFPFSWNDLIWVRSNRSPQEIRGSSWEQILSPTRTPNTEVNHSGSSVEWGVEEIPWSSGAIWTGSSHFAEDSSECHVIALWDSITAGYNLPVNDAYPAKLEAKFAQAGYLCKVTNAGVSGDTSKSLLNRMEFTLSDTPYTLAILTIGGNDGLQNLPIKELRENIADILAILKKRNIPVILSGMQIPENAGQYAKEFKDLYPSLAEELGVPLFPFFLEWVALKKDFNLPDGIHPNTAGYEIIANNLFDFVEKNTPLEGMNRTSSTKNDDI